MKHPADRGGSPGLIVLFGSGEMSPTGRKIHEEVFRQQKFTPPVSIGILETPTGFEVNAIHSWPERIENYFKKSLVNYKPSITRIRAWRKDGAHSTNNPTEVDAILAQQYLYCGAGSPSYTITHLQNSRALANLATAHNNGTTLCLGSASAMAIGTYTIPVYEIFKVGADPYWLKGLNILASYGITIAIVPHWNNTEGEDFDATHCWMGKTRFQKLEQALPNGVIVLGIDEQTACVLDIAHHIGTVMGTGNVYIRKAGHEQVIPNGSSFDIAIL